MYLYEDLFKKLIFEKRSEWNMGQMIFSIIIFQASNQKIPLATQKSLMKSDSLAHKTAI